MKSTFWMTAQEAENEINSRQIVVPRFVVGDKVKSTSFTDCFHKFNPEVPNLVVREVRRISCNHIPDYDLVTVYSANGSCYSASARFFEREVSAGADRPSET